MKIDALGELILGRYRLDSQIAAGGMAAVYRATDLELRRPAAIKIPFAHLIDEPGNRQRVRREAEIISGLNHPGIVRLYDYGENNGHPVLVMEFVDGESLKSMLDRGGPIPVNEAVRITRGILDALDYAHRRGVLHRDVKPQNVLLARDGRVKLIDFGIAAAEGMVGATQHGRLFGSVHYIAPERLEGAASTPASDLYSVGVVLYRMLTGKLPFQGELVEVVAAQHSGQPPPLPSRMRPDVPLWMDRVVARAMAKSPGDRFPTAGAMAEELHARGQLQDLPTVSLPAPAPGAARVASTSTTLTQDVKARPPSKSRQLFPLALGALAILMLSILLAVGPLSKSQASEGAPSTPVAIQPASAATSTPVGAEEPPPVAPVPEANPPSSNPDTVQPSAGGPVQPGQNMAPPRDTSPANGAGQQEKKPKGWEKNDNGKKKGNKNGP